MKRTTGRELLKKLKEGTISTEERRLLEAWYDDYIEKAAPFDNVPVFVKDMEKLDENFPFVHRASRTRPTIYRLRYFRLGAAAAIVLVLLGTYLFKQKQTIPQQIEQLTQSEILPGSNGATLTLGNGSKIKLNTLEDGDIRLETGIQITKTKDGQLTYTINETQQNQNQTHTLSTEKGETYALILPDKSRVWLNAASSLTYHTAPIQQGQRKVVLDGEAYFEVSKDIKHPFIVESEGQKIEVLGTSFNINAYQEGAYIETTLLEGSVKLTSLQANTSAFTRILRPNQQAIVKQDRIDIQEVVASDVIAWKEGYFLFDSENLESVMQKIARWYNVSVVYDTPSLKKETMLGTMSRHEQLSKVLDIIERTGIARFEVKERVIHVRKK